MFKELVPILRNRAVLMTATALDDDQIRVNVVPKKMKDGDHDALTTPLSVTGTAEELDTQLAATLVGFVASHLQMKNALEKAKARWTPPPRLRRPRRARSRRRRQGQYRRRRKSLRMLPPPSLPSQ
jgi:PRTRC genetic system protein E